MITPESKEPRLLESEGYLIRALRRLGEGLGPYVADKTGDASLEGTRDISVILGKMLAYGIWDRYFQSDLDHSGRGYVNQLRDFRNGPWAHLAGYDDDDVLLHIGAIRRLLDAVSATEQAQAVGQMYDELFLLIADLKSSSDKPTRQQPSSEVAELRQQISELQNNQLAMQQRFTDFLMTQISGQPESGRLAARPMLPAPDALAVPAIANPIPQNIQQPEDFVNLGKAALRERNFDQAIECFNRAVELDPALAEDLKSDIANAYQARGNDYTIKGQYNRAIADLSAALDLYPHDADLYNDRGDAYLEKGEYERAIYDFDDALALDSDHVYAYFNRGNAYKDDGDYHQAISDYSAAIELDQDFKGPYINRGNLYLDLMQYDRAIADFDDVLEIDPGSADAYYKRGFAYHEKKEYDRAIDDFNAALERNPDHADAYFNRGNAYKEKDEYDRAIADFNAALERNPNFVDAYYNRGRVYQEKDEHDQAVADFSSALGCNPDFVSAYIFRSFSYYNKGEYDRAIADFSEILRLDPKFRLYYLIRADTYILIEEYNKAIADFESVIALEPDGTLAESAQERMERAIRLRDGITEYDQAIEDNPRDPEGWHLRGLHYLDDLGDRPEYDRAVADFSEAIRLAPENAAIRYDRGRAYYGLGDYTAAYVDYSRAIDLKPDDYIAWCERGRAHQRRDEHRNAIADFDQSLVLKPDFALAYQLRSESHARIGNREQAQTDFEMWRGLA